MEKDFLKSYYENYDEEGRLLSRHGQVEYRTTMRCIRECLAGREDPSILEVGAGTGRYSVTLAKHSYRVTAVELVEHNLEILRSKLSGTEPITALQGNALDLSALPDESFDLTMLLGPMYHLYTRRDKLQALREAVRVTKPGGKILVAYCMNEPTVVQYVFGLNHLRETMDLHMLTPDWHCISEPKDLFELVRPEDIASLDAEFPVRRLKLVATDGATNFMRASIDSMDDETFAAWLDYHFAVCERQDLIGASHHTLDVLEKREAAEILEESCGAVVYTRVGGELRFVLVRSLEGIYGFPKGHVEPGETPEQTALREIFEETGLRVKLRPGFQFIDEHPIPGKPGVLKVISYFLAEYADQPIRAQESELLGAGLYSYDEAQSLFRYEDTRRILKKAYEFLAINKE